MTRSLAATACAAVLTLAGCGADERAARQPPTPATTAAGTPSSTQPAPDPTASAEQPPPAPVAVAAPLAWEPTLRPVEETVTAGGGWTIVVDQERSLATVDGPVPRTVAGSKRFRVSEVLLGTAYAVIVASDTLEEKPAVATVIDLATGRRTTVDGRSPMPTTSGGTWALSGDLLAHATVSDGEYCLAQRDLATAAAEVSWCAQERHGFTSAQATPAGLTLTGFDDGRPSCRTVGSLVDGGLEPFPGIADCRGWEGTLAGTGRVWSVIPRENRLDEAHVYASVAEDPDGMLDLGPATAGTLTWCGGATYFVRDPRAASEPARLLRWTDAGVLEIVYESKGGQAFLSEPRCGGDRITVSAFAESGDEQVSAPLG